MRNKCMSYSSSLVFSLYVCFSVVVSVVTAPLHKVCTVPLLKPVQVLLHETPSLQHGTASHSSELLANLPWVRSVPLSQRSGKLRISYKHLFSANGWVWIWIWSACVNYLSLFSQEELLQVQSMTDAYPGRNMCAPALGGIFCWIHRPISLCLCFYFLYFDFSFCVLRCHSTDITWAGETSVSLFIKLEQQRPKECDSSYRLRSCLLKFFLS